MGIREDHKPMCGKECENSLPGPFQSLELALAWLAPIYIGHYIAKPVVQCERLLARTGKCIFRLPSYFDPMHICRGLNV